MIQLAYDRAEQGKCVDCGDDPAACGDPERVWYPQRHVCYATMAREALNWRYDDLYEGLFHDGTLTRWSNKQSVDFPNAARDGVTLWVAQMDLDPKRAWLAKPPLAVGQVPDGPVDPESPAVE